MNSTINKTFYTCSAESLFLRYKKISKKALKLGNFLQYSIHIFLGLDGGFWKINLRLLWNHIMKNFQVKHGQCDSIIFPETFSFESSKYLLDLCLAGSRILYFWQVLESIHKFIIELHVLQCLFVRGSNKKQRSGRIISSFTKGEIFHLLWQPSALGGNLAMWSLFSHPPKKAYLSPSHWLKREHTWMLNWKESLLICFENSLVVPYFHRQSRNRLINTFIIVIIIPTCKR